MVQKTEQDVMTKVKEFAESIKDSEIYREFREKKETLDENEEAQNLLVDFQRKQIEMRQEGYSEELYNEIMKNLDNIKENKIIQEYGVAQKKLLDLLNETNNLISDKLGTPFAQGKGGGCCGG